MDEDATITQIVGRDRLPIRCSDLKAMAEICDRVVVDLGTGDGTMVLDSARSHPTALFIGIDAVAENMREASRRAAGKPQKGGASNCLFLVASVESLPPSLSGFANEVTINYPWGSLLNGVVKPDLSVLESIAGLLRSGGRLLMVLNYSVFAQEAYRERLGLPPLDTLAVDDRFRGQYYCARLEIIRREHFTGDPPFRTTWGRRLVRGSHRASLLIEAVRLESTIPGPQT